MGRVQECGLLTSGHHKKMSFPPHHLLTAYRSSRGGGGALPIPCVAFPKFLSL